MNIGSLAGRHPFKGGVAYNASKFGLVGLSEAMMLDLRGEGIRVATVMPGSVATGFAGRSADDGEEWKLSPEDVAEAVLAVVLQRSQALASRIELRPSRPAGKASARLASPRKELKPGNRARSRLRSTGGQVHGVSRCGRSCCSR